MKSHTCCRCAKQAQRELEDLYRVLDECRDVLLVYQMEEKMGVGVRVSIEGGENVSVRKAVLLCDQMLSRREAEEDVRKCIPTNTLPLVPS